ncbi:MAG: electron transporter RnfD [Ruminococcus sp.]|nr:electron transporter RnfD [Ruminococcus sp.]
MSRRISPLNATFAYSGRIDSYEGMPRFFYAATSVTVRFKATAVSAVIVSHKMYGETALGIQLDGRVFKLPYEQREGEIVVPIAEGLEYREHELTLYKAQAGSCWFEFGGFEFSDDVELLPKKELPSRRIECYGDSVSAGEVVHALDCVGKNDPEDHGGIYDDAWYAFPVITARNLGAQIHDIAQGGISIFDRTGWFHCPDTIGMESVYDKVAFFPEAQGGVSKWDFTKYTPDVVLFAVGQNDPHVEGGEDNDINDPEFRSRWKKRYTEILLDLRGHYPNAVFILLLTVLGHSHDWDDVLDEIVEELGDDKTVHYRFTRAGEATPGHPRVPEQYEMAEELTAFISAMGDGIWSGSGDE